MYYVLHNIEATATDMPISLIDTEGEDINDSCEDNDVQVQGFTVQEKELHKDASSTVCKVLASMDHQLKKVCQ